MQFRVLLHLFHVDGGPIDGEPGGLGDTTATGRHESTSEGFYAWVEIHPELTMEIQRQSLKRGKPTRTREREGKKKKELTISRNYEIPSENPSV